MAPKLLTQLPVAHGTIKKLLIKNGEIWQQWHPNCYRGCSLHTALLKNC
jgi:hypothetical protein